MFKSLAHALHHLFNPHCNLCESLRAREHESMREHELELRVCQSCETLKTQLEFQNQLIRELTRPPVNIIEDIPITSHKPIFPGHKPWALTKFELEKKDRELAAALRAKKAEEITADNLEAQLPNAQPS